MSRLCHIVLLQHNNYWAANIKISDVINFNWCYLTEFLFSQLLSFAEAIFLDDTNLIKKKVFCSEAYQETCHTYTEIDIQCRSAIGYNPVSRISVRCFHFLSLFSVILFAKALQKIKFVTQWLRNFFKIIQFLKE